MNSEIELKLSLPRGSLAALRRHALLAQSPKLGNAATLDNVYFDTPDLLLKASKTALRLRRHGRRQVQTVKSAALSTAGLSQRPEWERPFSGEFDFSGIDAAKVRKLLQSHQAQLMPVFSTRFRRETRLYSPAPDIRILIMIDIGEVTAGERSVPLRELELELQQGEPRDLLNLAGQLSETLPLLPCDISKAERGYRLYENEPAAPYAAASSAAYVRIAPTLHASEAFRQLAYAAIRQWQNCLESAMERGAPDSEHIHQLHLIQRRLRVLLYLFRPALPKAFFSAWRSRFRDNGRRFGAIRDIDVLSEAILAPPVSSDEQENLALERLRDTVRRQRDSMLRDCGLAAEGSALLEFMIALHALPEQPSAPLPALAVFAARQLDGLRRQMLKRLKIAGDEKTAAQLHALRIALKHLYYGISCFASLLPTKKTARYLKRLNKIRNRLGFVHDVDSARRQLAALADDDAAFAVPAAFVCGWHSPRYFRQRRRALRELEKLSESDVPWQRPH